jgi:two-component system sensor histidine kinase ChvG
LRPELARALDGEIGSALRHDEAGRTVLSVAVPVQRYKRILGAVMLSKDTRFIDQAVYEVRLDILKVFAIALAVTVLLSIYLAGTIARPIRRLAVAAERIRLGRHATIPDFTDRNDEIGELSGALRDMTDALWKRMDAIEQFAADVAHEIKNPLSSVQSAVETIARLDDPEQQKKLLQIVRDDVARLDRLISDISSASRIDAELSRAKMEPVDIGALLRTLTDFLRDTGDTEKVKIKLNGESDSAVLVAGLEDRLVQVFRNLISNAVSFSPPGGTILLTIAASTGWVEITVDDDGPGIPEGAEESIFQRFYRERPADEQFGTHSGLGLSISKQIVDAHRGTIVATNRKSANRRNLGARFTVRLPAMG